MRHINVDFNEQTSDKRIALTTIGSLNSIASFKESLHVGERVLLSDGEIEVEAVLERRVIPESYLRPSSEVWQAVPDDKTWRDVAK